MSNILILDIINKDAIISSTLLIKEALWKLILLQGFDFLY